MRTAPLALVVLLAAAPALPAVAAFGIPPLDMLLIAWSQGCGYEAPYMTRIPAGVSGAGTYTDAKGKRHVYVEGPTQDTNLKNHCVANAQVTLVTLGAAGTYREDRCPGCGHPLLP